MAKKEAEIVKEAVNKAVEKTGRDSQEQGVDKYSPKSQKEGVDKFK